MTIFTANRRIHHLYYQKRETPRIIVVRHIHRLETDRNQTRKTDLQNSAGKPEVIGQREVHDQKQHLDMKLDKVLKLN
jgi:hypothetical protein